MATNGYCTLAELKAELFRGTTATDEHDIVLDTLIEAVSRQIENETGRRFYTASETRVYTARWHDLLMIDELVSLTSLKTDDDGDGTHETTWATTDYNLLPYNAQTNTTSPHPYTMIEISDNGRYVFPTMVQRGVQLAGSFGYCTAANQPEPIRRACIIQCVRLWKRVEAPFGVVGASEMGQQIVIAKLDPDVRLLLAPYVRFP